MPTFDHAGITINYAIQGQGDPLLLVMGLGGDLEGWRYQVDELARDFQVIVFDNRGIGGSSIPEETSHYSMGHFAADAIALLDHLFFRRAHVFGISMGGMIAQHIALRYPERVRGLVLGCTTPGGAHGIQPEPWVLELLLAGGMKSPEEATRDSISFNFSPDFPNSHPEVIAEYIRRGTETRMLPHGFIGQWTAIMGHDTLERLPQIALPTLVQHGTADVLVPFANGELIASAIPGARLQPIEGAGHVYFIEQPALVNRSVRDFLKGVGPV